ncbi:glycosyltransferase family 1 protein [Thalassotalea euphylliae]|uniref:Glycosyltransferase family 1 protein n=1 Tax=Thalassotalea euphylliae TaxID=1655234 RepID=A0A3E0TVM9_9GAMM|nr:glycosyltransferase family 1 protein [Thalassotalea euphylliae]REL28005.1 glycosyltransferase family 1 protein [Thalassotalea euphylliae]
MDKSANNDCTQGGNEPIASRPMIVFGEDWGAHPSSTQHLVKVLSTQRDIVWVNSIGLRKPRFNWRDLTRIVSKLKARFFGQSADSMAAHTGQDNRASNNDFSTQAASGKGEQKGKGSYTFTVINPLVFPCTDQPILAWLNKLLLKQQLRRAMKKLSGKPIVWASLPTAVDYLSLFERKQFDCDCVYYCGDDFSALAGVDHDFVVTKEQELCERASTVFAASQPLVSKLPQQKTVVIPHGVDCQLFQSPKVASGKRGLDKVWPRDLPMGKPIAGFYGSVSQWLDQSLLAQSAETLPNWNFVLIGNIECDVSLLTKYKNIHFLEAKPHECLPQYIQHWQVAMLPFKNSQQIRMCNPLKLREYLASGTPIASTYFNALAEYQHLVEVASEQQSFARSIVLASRRSSVAEVKSRVASVKQASWQRRAEQVSEYLLFSR